MRVVKGEILRLKAGHGRPAGWGGSEYCVSLHTGDVDEIGVLPSDGYGQTSADEALTVAADDVERTGKLVWEYDRTLFPHVVQLLKEYYLLAVYGAGS